MKMFVMMRSLFFVALVVFAAIFCSINSVSADISHATLKKIKKINNGGPYLGIVVPNSFEMNPLLQSSSFEANRKVPYLDFSGRRFRIGKVENQKVIVVMTGLSMLNAGITTQLLLSLFKVKGVLHYGIAGNANPELQIGDVTVPRFWAHTGLWNWQRYGQGPNDSLALESNGDYTRKIGYLRFSDYNNNTDGGMSQDNLLNNAWYQPEEIFPVNGTPELREHAFWVPVSKQYLEVAKGLKNLKLGGCVNTTCLPRTPKVVTVDHGVSANVFVDNRAYREFLHSKFKATPIDMESASVGLICLQQQTPFIAIRALSDLAGGGSALSNEADIFASLAAENAVAALIKFIDLLSS